jgi:hypothetical protein
MVLSWLVEIRSKTSAVRRLVFPANEEVGPARAQRIFALDDAFAADDALRKA